MTQARRRSAASGRPARRATWHRIFGAYEILGATVTRSGALPVSMQRTYRFEDIEVDPAERTLHVAGKPVSVGGRAFDLMLALMARAGALVSKDELLAAVWGPLVVEEANLHVHVSALRKLLGAGAIETVPGRGYRLLLAPAPDAAGVGRDRRPDRAAQGRCCDKNRQSHSASRYFRRRL